jgi:chromosome segregation ATPase
MIRKTIAFLSLIILITSIFLAISINDVAPSSDLYPYVVEMVQNNIMKLDSNSNFNGTLVVTRSDLARILSRLLNYVQGRVQPVTQVSQAAQGTSSATTSAISNELSMKIQKLEDAVKKYYNFESYISNTSSSLSGIITEIDQMKVQLEGVQKTVASLKNVNSLPPSSLLSQALNDEKELKTKFETLSAQLSALKVQNEMNAKKMKNLSSSINATITKLRTDFSNLNLSFSSMENEKEMNSQRLSDALNKMNTATSKMENLSKENADLKKEVGGLKATLNNIYLFQALEAVTFIGVLVFVLFTK